MSVGHHIRNSVEELYSCLHFERSQALFAVRRAGYSLLLFSLKMCVVCPPCVHFTNAYFNQQSCSLM